MAERYVVVLGAGSLREDSGSVVAHEWTTDGVSVRCEASGTHVLHLAVAGGVLDELYRVAAARGVPLRGVQVRAEGAVEPGGTESTGVEWSVAMECPVFPEDADALISAIDPVATLPESLCAGLSVRRVGHV